MTGHGEYIRILIADGHAMFCDALSELLEQEPGIRVVGCAGDGEEILRQVTGLKPDLLLMDLAMPALPGLEVLRRVLDIGIKVRIIVLTAAIDRSQYVEALRLGVHGIVLKDAPTQFLFKAIRVVMAGEYWIGHAGITDLIEHLRTIQQGNGGAPLRSNGYHLSTRELEIVDSIMDGCTNKDMAIKFLLSEQTVKHHLTNIFMKVGVLNRLELALYATQHRHQPGKAMATAGTSVGARVKNCA